MKTKFEEILNKAASKSISRDEALHLFYETENYPKAQELFKVAGKVRDNTLGTTFKWTAGVASVLPCNLDPLCLYCPYWMKKQKDVLSMEEILKGVRYIREEGIREFHLSAGTTLGSGGEEMVEIVKTIREMDSDSRIHVNCGAALSQDSIMKLKKLGVTRIGASFETINEKLFQQTKPGDSLKAKKKLAEMINDAGLELGSGLLAGLGCKNCSEKCPTGAAPGKLEPSMYEDYVDFMFYVKQFENLTSVYVSRFFPYAGIPLADHPRCSAMEGSRIIAVMRLVLRDVRIGPAAGWSYDDIPLWVSAGGGNTIGGIHVNRTPHYRGSWYLPKALDYREELEFRNTIPIATKFLQELGMSVEY